MIHACTVAVVLGLYVDWRVALAWFAISAASVLANLHLMRLAQRAAMGKTPQWTARGIWANSVLSVCLQAPAVLLLWETNQTVPAIFGVLTALVGATYVLLQYYSDPLRFRILVAPFLAIFFYIAADLAWSSSFSVAAALTAVAAAASLANFFYLSRRLLDRSRTALRLARAEAQEKEIAAEAANAAKSAFLASMSHEIRTPLNGVLGMAQAMAADHLSDVQRERLAVIHGSGQTLLAILNDVLDLSKIEAGRLELEVLEFDLGEVALGAYSAFTALANKKGLSFALEIDQARGRYLGDPTRMRQILYNLISNALKFTDHGVVRLRAWFHDGQLEASVTDTGLGISTENLRKLFGKFEQLDSSTTRRFGGTGLGLSICRELSELMGGSIRAESEVGRGSTFTVSVPLTRIGEEKPPASVSAQPEPGQIDARVLAAEDNTVNQLILKTLLHQMGIEPTVVDNGAAAVEAWEAAPWDVVLMDIHMPVVDGLTATAEIRSRETQTGRRRTPIIALTANAMSDQVQQYLAAGMDGHVAKPIEAAALLAALSSAVAETADGQPAAAA